MKLTEQEIEEFDFANELLIKSYSTGERYNNFSYERVYTCVRGNYAMITKSKKNPFIVVCENPVESDYVCNMMQYLWGIKDSKFLELFNLAFKSANDNSSISIIEKNSKKLLNYVIDIIDKDHSKYMFLSEDNEKYYATMSIYSDIYFEWFELLKRKKEPYYEGYELFKGMYKDSNIFSSITRSQVCIVSKFPKFINLEKSNNRWILHSVEQPSISFGYNLPIFNIDRFYIRGRGFDETIFKGFTREQFLNEDNDEVRAAMYEILISKGMEYAMEFLGAEEVETLMLTHNVDIPVFGIDGHFVGYRQETQLEDIRLYRTKENIKSTIDTMNGEEDVKLAWIRFICPSTKTSYLIPTFPSLTIIDAIKESRPVNMGDYSWRQRS